MEHFAELRLILLAWLILAVPVCLAGAGLWPRLPWDCRRLFPPQRHHVVSWTGLEVFFVLVFSVLCPSLVYSLLFPGSQASAEEPLTPEGELKSVVALMVSLPWFLASSWLLLRLARGVRLYQLGVHVSRWRQNVLLGGLAWFVGTLPLLLVNWLVSLALQAAGQPVQQHSITLLVRGEESFLGWVLILTSVLIVAPLLEELLFRGILLRWAGQLSWRSIALFVIALSLGPLNNWKNPDSAWQAGLFGVVLLPGLIVLPAFLPRQERLRRPLRDATNGVLLEVRPLPLGQPESFWDRLVLRLEQATDPGRANPAANGPQAIYATAFLFAIVHPWPTPIPLFLFGLLLGWLAYRTQSLVGPMVLHMLFNATSCIMLALGGVP
jgi:membrane protease YdiL (CAAX protease family)